MLPINTVTFFPIVGWLACTCHGLSPRRHGRMQPRWARVSVRARRRMHPWSGGCAHVRVRRVPGSREPCGHATRTSWAGISPGRWSGSSGPRPCRSCSGVARRTRHLPCGSPNITGRVHTQRGGFQAPLRGWSRHQGRGDRLGRSPLKVPPIMNCGVRFTRRWRDHPFSHRRLRRRGQSAIFGRSGMQVSR